MNTWKIAVGLFLFSSLTVFGKTVVKPVEHEKVPFRVHVFEDYETDIEKRWWLRGEPIRKSLPLGLSESLPNKRACRSTETKDFDRKMGDRSKTYQAVIFNPVPGPPMAGNTHLSFRCQLKRTDFLRCQIYSLSKGYHRHLVLRDLPRDKWQALTVDMTAARRPDGSGGPLEKDERIDDIQFYVEEGAEVSVDDVVLFEPARIGEKEAFPRRFIFTGWFDTGKQGKGHEWPGDFDIVLHEKPLAWDAAKAVQDVATGNPWLRVNLRGVRPLSERNRLRFRCNTSAKEIQVSLHDTVSNKAWEDVVKVSKQGIWQNAAVDFQVKKGSRATDIIFRIPTGENLQVDDLLLYEPDE